ncbi:MAG: tRNA (adenosine(37)-N6)-threonylcarbamoyltransferase complex dimerization subunit type 1 TsaB [Polyangiaceae bacterium]|nr:tRNA (adenosine(37)-N6)-threonylcarbamoyltransferase complex dimerization subunit type 1 TsaB [Polyangiaceae bacterium]
MKVLALSTSTYRGSAAVLDGDRVLGASGYADLGGHAERIFSAVTEALEAAAVSRSEIELVACDIGPGSFTGVRVGVASAKGLALGLGAALVGVGSLEAMAAAAFVTGAAGPKDVVVSVLDAKKQEFFIAAHDASGQTLWAPAHVPIADAFHLLSAWTEFSRLIADGYALRIVGEAALLEPSMAAQVVRGASVDLPDAVAVGRVGLRRFASSKGVAGEFDASLLEPSYVRPPDAKPMASGAAS